MKIDKSRLKQSTSEVPSECQSLIDKLKACSRVELIRELAHVETWTFGKCELYHWISILDVFDGILEEAAASQANKWYLACDTDFAEDEKHLLLSVLHFTTLLIEHSFSRHLYNSMEHLITLLSSSNMQVVLGVLNLLYMFSKRSNFITRLNSEKRQSLLCRLNYLAESWGGKEYGFGLAECCTMKQMSRNASTLYYEYFAPDGNWESIHIKDVHLSPAEYMKNISKGELSEDKMMHVFTRLRLAVGFQKYPARLQFVQARLQALSVLVYSNALQENAHTLLYPGFLEELVELLQLQLPHLVEIRAAALRTLTSIIHLDRNPHFPKKPGSRLSMIIDVTGAGSYHGFLPVLVRTCIGTLTMPKTNDETLFPLPLATALFSFLYHLASYESGGEALVSCGMMESLLRVINWPGNELEHITFVTRAVRVIDLITNIDMQAFQAHGGLNSFVSRLHMEVDLCCREQQLVPLVNIDEIFVGGTVDPITLPIPSTSKESVNLQESTNSQLSKSNRTCLPQRAALLKSMLNFLKKAIQDPAFSDSIRYVMEGTLPTSLKHIISSAEYYGPSLFLLATDVVTVYVFQEPSHLSSLQDNGLTEVVLHALLIKDVPATREVLGSLPNVFSALCLNARGLLSFIMCKPFDRLFNVLLSPIYLAAMRRRRNSHPMSDTASNLGNAMDELMRHQPSLKGDATTAIIKLLEKLVQLGSDPQYVCWRAQSKVDISMSPAPTTRPTGPNEAGSSDEEDEDEEEVSTSSQNQREDNQQEAGSQMNERTPIALVDYILNVMKFVDAILSNNSTDDHCKEFVSQGGLVPLLSILGLPNLPVDCPVTAAAQSVASVCKSILNLGHEPLVLQLGLEQLYRVVQSLQPLYNHLKAPGSSVLLGELANTPNVETAFSSATATPLLHAMGAAHGYIVMFVHVCRTGQSEIRTLALQKWGQDTEYGKSLLLSLVHLYTSLVWESTLLLALCSDDIIPPGCDFGKEDLDKLLPPELRDSEGPWSSISTQDCGSNGMTSAMEALSTDSLPPLTMDIDYVIASTSGNDKSKEVASRLASFAHQIKYIKPLLGASSRLGRALAELFGLLVKLCVGSPIRQRRGQVPPTPTLNNPESKEIARVLSYILVDGLAWEKLPPSPIPKFRLTFLICSVGFISPMLFDEKRYAYHLMIHMFVEEGGQASFFDTFRWALSAGGTIPLHEGLEHPNLPDGTGEFLDAWLMLLEKMVNPKSILDSPHVIPFRDRHESGFEPTQYLQQIHRLAFNAIMMMWGKKPLKCYGSRMSETILSIIRHILRGEQIIAERTTATREEAAGGTDNACVGESGSAGAYLSALQTAGTTVNPEHLKQLVDMGFTEEHCSQALRHTTTVEQATEYLLNNPPPLPRVPNSSMEVDLSEDDQMLCAIAMSLGDNGLEINAHNADSSSSKKRKNHYEAPLTEDVMSHFTKGALAACLTLLDTLPDTVYRVCVLLVTIAKRNGDTWRSIMLDSLICEIESHINYLIAIAESGKQPAEIVSELINSTISAKASVTIYLFTLLFEGAKIMDMRIPNIEVVRCAHIVPSLVKLFLLSEKFMTEAGSIPCFPKWMASLLLLINLAEKVCVVVQRRKMFDDVTNPVWGCYDYNGGKWSQYSTQNNKIINNAYDMGEDSCRVVCGRQRYHLSFNDFTQTENESYGIKYIMKLPKSFEVINSRKYNINTNKKSDECIGENSKDAMDVDTEEEDDYMVNDHTQETVHPLGLSSDMQGVVVTSCVRMMKFPIDRDTMHALMRICLRYTQDRTNALLFEIEGGVKILLESAHSTSYTGFVNLATLLIRHVIEEPRTLRYAMEYVLRIRTMPNIPPTYRELFYMSCNQLSAAIARDPVVFQTMASDVLRIDVNSLAKRQDDTRPLVKCIPQTELKAPLMKDFVATRCIHDLLNALVLPSPGNTSAPLVRDNAQYQGDSSSPDEGPIIMTISLPPPRPEPLILPLLGHGHRVRRIVGQPHIDMLRSNHTGNDTSHTEPPEDEIPDSNRPFRDSIQSNIKVTEDEPKRPLLPKSVILKILAEAVRSYSTVPQLITDYSYQPGQSPLITEETKALAFILDKMLPIDNAVDRECSSTARMLIAAIASATDVPASQLSVVHEVKLALQRALAMPEGIEKHNQLQMLTGLIPTMLENCPPENPGLLKLHQHNPRKNGIYSIMVRKGLISDLARLPQNLDLSSPNMVATLNATLKPLESLLRISNQPVPVNSKFVKSKSQRRTTEVPGVSLSGVTNSVATHAQGEMGVEDSESADHDVSGTGENLEPSSEVDALDDAPHVTGLEEIMDQLLEQDTLESDHSYRPVRSGHVNINRNIGNEQPSIENIGYNPDRDATEDMISSDSGDSNEDSNGSEQDEREMEEDADDNDDEGELENDPYDYDDPLEFYDDEVAHSLFRRDRENEEVLMIHYQDPDNEAEPEGSGRNLVHWHSSNNSAGFSLPFGLLDDQPAAGEGSGVSQNHQLSMTRQNVDPGSVQFSRTHRTNRQRRYQYLHLNSRTSNPPVILQRLLGTAGQNMAMSASPITSGSGFRDSARVLVMDNGIGIFTNNHEEEQIDFVDQSGYLFGPTLSAALSNTPTALHWWHHEATLLDGDSKFHLGFYLCTKILKDLEKHKGIELAKTRGKRKKRQEEIEPIATPKIFQGTQSTCGDSVRSSAGRGLSRSRDFAEITSGFLNSFSNILPAVNADQENLGFDTPLNNTETQSSSSSAVSPQTDETGSVTCTEASSITSSTVPVGDVVPLHQINHPDDDLSENNATISNNQLSMTGVRESVPLYQMIHRSTTRPVDNSSDSESLHINQSMNTDSNSEIVETVPPTTLRSVIDLAENNSSGSLKSKTVGTETPEFKSLESDLSEPISNNCTLMEQNSPDNYSQSLPPPLFLTNETNSTLSFSIPDPFVPPRLEINFSSSDEADEQLNRVRVRRRYAPTTDAPPDEELVLRLNSLESEEQLVLRLESSESDNQLVLHIDSSESEEQLVLRLDSNEPDERLALHIDASESDGGLVLHIDASESDETTSCIASASLPVPRSRSYQSNNQMRLIDSDESTVILSPNEATNEYNIQSVESAEGSTSVDSPLTVRSPEGLTTAESSESDEQLMCISSFPAATVSEVQTTQVPSATIPDITSSSDESSVKDHSSAHSVSRCPLGGELESTQQISQMPIQLEDQPRPSTSRTIDIAIAGSSSGVSDIPEGVDPSFLNALPAEVRAEVIEDHIRQQRREAQCARVQDAPLGLSEVSPEFLAALPPSIQEEVLAQQRMELQRQAAAAANPDDPVDAAAFFQNLQPSLRQAILTDMDESQISSLPPDIAAEAQNLRRDLESRNRQLMHERFLQQNALSSILRTGRGVRGARYAIHSLPQRAGHWAGGPYSRTDGNPSTSANMTTIIVNMERLGRPLLDHESLTCLLVLLFIDEPKFNTLRLHRVIRNLCYHVPTRDWVIKSLLSIIEKCNENSDPYPLRSLNSVDRPQWLNISLDAALGCRANVFLMKRVITRRQKSLSPISIHPQAAAVVCKHTLELLISLAKSFPSYFLPLKSNQPKKDVEASTSGSNATKGSKHESEGRPTTDFWEILVKLDTSSGQSRKGKGAIRISKEFGEADGAPKSFETSLFGQLITMLSYNVIKKSSQLTDKLLRLISLISSELHFNPFCAYNANKNKLPVVLEEDCLPESEEHLKLAIQVLTSKSCSEEGLEDATALLLNLSHYSEDTRHLILRLLMDGAISLGVMVKSHIAALMKELKAMRVKTQEKLKDDASSGDSLKASKGVLKDRFTRNAVIVAAPIKMKIACELQLPAMAPLISKTSSQAFFLRILKVICQIRDAIKDAVNKKISLKSGQKASRPNIESNTSSEIAMDISAAECASLSSLELKDYLSVLSDSLDLDVLWDTLSECLLELEETPDHHAVLVLQPAVEAFFLVHSASQSKKRSGDSANDQVDDAPIQVEREHGSQVTATSETSSEPAVGDHATVSNALPMVSGSPQSVDSFEIAPLSPLESNVENSLDLANTARASSVPSTSLLTYVLVDKHKFLSFAETHRTVLNQILRQTTTHLSDGPFSVLVDHTRVLDFDVKRRYFRTELERLDEGIRREELAVHVRRSNVFEDSFRELYRRNPEEWKNRFYIVFEDEEGQDAGGLLREWYVIISRDIFNPNYALFTVSPGDRVTYMINSSSHCNPNHLCYFKFVGRVIAKAIYDNKLLECYFTRSFYKQILGIQVKHTDMESEDYTFYKSLVYLMEHQVADIGYECTFSTEIQEFGVTEVRDLIPNGRNKPVTEVNKHEYIRLVCQMQMCGAIRQQLNAFLEGFYEIIPKRLISIFNEQELELLISGLPNVDIEDLKANTEYHKYQTNSIQIQWFWRSLRSFDQADRAKFLQFVTGTSKVPLQGFAALEGMNGVQKFQIHRDDRSTDRLPSAHTCFNQLDLPVYETYDKLRSNLLKAIHECSEGFGFA